jgi:NADPH:quinone reductase-like Zn-dependent oxidoreductase
MNTTQRTVLIRAYEDASAAAVAGIPKPEAGQGQVLVLENLGADIAKGTLKSRVSEVIGFEDIPAAIERNRTNSRSGKVVADFSR